MINAPTTVTIPATPQVAAGFLQADSITIVAGPPDSNGVSVFLATCIVSTYGKVGNQQIFVAGANGVKVTHKLTITNIEAQAAKRASQGNPNLANAFTALEAAIQSEYATQLAEQTAVLNAQAQLNLDQQNKAPTATINADKAALAAALSAAAQWTTVPTPTPTPAQ